MKDETAYYAENEKNVRLTVVGWGDNHDNDDELTIDFAAIAKRMKRLLALWLCFAIGLGALSGAAALAARKLLRSTDVKALVSLSSADYDIRKIKSPGVVEAALNEMGLATDNLENIRDSIELDGVIPDSAYDRMSMYYNLVSQNGGNASVIQSLLDTPYDVSSYVISFDYSGAKFSPERGIDFMNALLRAYQEYLAKNYNDNTALGNPLGAIDYKDYDYAEAANIFSTTLNRITSYLSAVESPSAGFRSAETGFTFQDLRRAAETLREIDLDLVSSYIVIHSVSSFDAETEVSYYEWMIENLTRQRTVQRTKLASLTRSIEDYEKDPVLIAMQDGSSVVASQENLNDNYDSMIQEKLDTQSAIASYTRSISYYESVIEGFQGAEAATPEDVEKVKEYLSSLNDKVKALIESVTKTANEYYEKTAFANRVQVLIPATNDNSSQISLRDAIMIVLVVEFLNFGVFFALAFKEGVRRGKPADQADDERRQALSRT